MEARILTPREFQVAKIAVSEGDPPDTIQLAVTPLPASRRQETVLVFHVVVTDDAGNRANYDLRLRAADGALSIKPISGTVPPRRARRDAAPEGGVTP